MQRLAASLLEVEHSEVAPRMLKCNKGFVLCEMPRMPFVLFSVTDASISLLVSSGNVDRAVTTIANPSCGNHFAKSFLICIICAQISTY